MKNPFWNSQQHRPRALWRLMGQLVLFVLGCVVVSMALSALVMARLAAQSGIEPLRSDRAMLQRTLLTDPTYVAASRVGVAIAMVGSTWLAGRFLDRRRFAQFGFHLHRGWWLDFAFGLALGAVLMAGIFAVEWAVGWLAVAGTLRAPDGQAFLPAILSALLGFLAVGVYEELFSRGYQLRNLAEGLNGGLLGSRGAILLAWLLSSSFFGILHASNPHATLLSTANLVAAGLFLGLGCILTGELAIPIGLHIGWNFCQGNVFGFPVSGTEAGATLLAITQGGPELWTGGTFGPEAGLMGLAATLAGSGLIVAWVRARRGRAMLWQPLAEPPRLVSSSKADRRTPPLSSTGGEG